MPSLTPHDFQLLVETYDGDEEAARAALQRRGYTIEGEEDGSDFAVMDGELPVAGSDLSVGQGLTGLQSLAQTERQSITDLYNQIEQSIAERYRAPDFNDLLVAIGTGMMTPPGENDRGGFMGSLQRGLQGVGAYAQNRRAYEDEMNKMRSQLEIQQAKDLAGLRQRYLADAAALMKPRAPSTASPIIVGADLVPRSRQTGSSIKEPPQEAIYALQDALKDPSKTPQDKVTTRRNFDKVFGYGASDIYGRGL